MLFPQAFRNINEFLAHIARLGYSVSNWDRTDVIPLERHHAAELALVHQIDRSNAIARRQHAIKSRWRPTALDMTKHYGARLKTGAGLKFRSQRVSDPAKPHMPELICLPALGIGSAVG